MPGINPGAGGLFLSGMDEYHGCRGCEEYDQMYHEDHLLAAGRDYLIVRHNVGVMRAKIGCGGKKTTRLLGNNREISAEYIRIGLAN